MSELDLLNLARSTTEHEVTWFAQMITINFAMVVAIYYFLHSAKIALKIFSFFAYTVGIMVLVGEMLVEANVKEDVIEALRALPSEHLSRPSVRYLRFTIPGSRSSRTSLSIFPFGCFGLVSFTCSSCGNDTRSNSTPCDPPAFQPLRLTTMPFPRMYLIPQQPNRRTLMQLRILALIASLCLISATAFAADDSFVGKWKLNPAKSQFAGLTYKVAEAGPDKYTFTFGDDSETMTLGKEHLTKYGNTWLITKNGPNSWKWTQKRKGKITSDAIWSVSKDGATSTYVSTEMRPDGSTSHDETTLKRTAGTSGLAERGSAPRSRSVLPTASK